MCVSLKVLSFNVSGNIKLKILSTLLHIIVTCIFCTAYLTYLNKFMSSHLITKFWYWTEAQFDQDYSPVNFVSEYLPLDFLKNL